MKKISIFLLLFLLTGCQISINSGNSFESNSISDTSSTMTSEENYDYEIRCKETLTGEFSNSNFEFQNCSANLSSSGNVVLSNDNDSYRVGSNILSGTVNIEFTEKVVINSITFFAYSSNSTFQQEIIYNGDKTFFIDVSQVPYTTYDFNEPVLLSSLSFTCTGKNKSLFFKGLGLNKCEPIHVTGIEKKCDLDVEINRFVTIDETYEVLPSNATIKGVVISSNDEFVVIDGNKVKGTTVGEHSIKITTVDSGFSLNVTLNCTAETVLNGYRKINKARFTYDDLYIANRSYGVTPSLGKVKMFVVPVNFSDLVNVYDFTKGDNLDRLKACFTGTKSDNSNDYYESLKSFYYKSSYGNLDIDFVFTDVYTPSFTSSTFVNKERVDGGGTYYLIEEAYSKLTVGGKSINFNDSQYDMDNDGFVDGIWFVYNDDRYEKCENYWPYTYWYTGNSKINFSVYANCSVYFTYEGNDNGLDGHTLFHETGHMLGLDDYYVTGNTSKTSALGGLDMMDYNIGDHNAFSKFSLGWTNPYVVEDDSIITLRPFEKTGDSIIIPTNSFNDSAFSEYIILEYYTPTGLNAFDAENAYVNRSKYFTKNGIRMFHVDARLCKYYANNNFSYVDSSITNLTYSYSYSYEVAGSNTPSYSINGSHLIEAITRDNRSTFNGKDTNNSSLFVEGDIMDPSKYTSFFQNSKMHDNSTMEYKIEILYLDDDMCKISITK